MSAREDEVAQLRVEVAQLREVDRLWRVIEDHLRCCPSAAADLDTQLSARSAVGEPLRGAAMTPTQEVAELVGALTARVTELERWKAEMAVEVTTEMVRARKVVVQHPRMPEPAIRLSAFGDSGELYVGMGDEGPHVTVFAAKANGDTLDGCQPEPDNVGIYCYSGEDDLGLSIDVMDHPELRSRASLQLWGPEVQRPELVLSDGVTAPKLEVVDGEGQVRIRAGMGDVSTAEVKVSSMDLAGDYGQHSGVMLAANDDDPEHHTAGVGVVRRGNVAQWLDDDGLIDDR